MGPSPTAIAGAAVVAGIAALALWAGGRLLARARRRRRQARTLAATDLQPLRTVSDGDGMVLVSGTARPADGETVDAEIVGDEAVLVETVVESRGSGRGRKRRWTRDHRSTDHVPFVVEDGTDRAHVDLPEEATVLLDDAVRETVTHDSLAVTRPGEFGDHVPEGVRRYVEGHDTAPTATRRYRQGAVRPGQQVVVLAEATDGPPGWDAPDVTLTGAARPAVVLATDDEAHLDDLGREWVHLAWLGVAILVGGFAALAFAAAVLLQ